MTRAALLRLAAWTVVIVFGAGMVAQAAGVPVFRMNTKISRGDFEYADPEPSLATDGEGAVYNLWHLPVQKATSTDWGETFDAPQRLTDAWSCDSCTAALPGGTIYYCYMEYHNNWEVHVAKSTDYGQTLDFNKVVVPMSESPDRPWIYAEGDKVWVMYIAFDTGTTVYVRRSDDGGVTWGNRASVATGFIPGGIVRGRVGFDELHLCYMYYGGSDREVHVATSRDGGQTWPIQHTLGDYGDYGWIWGMFENVIADGKGNVYVVWPKGYDVNIGGQNYHSWHLVMRRSTDGGTTFEPEVQVLSPQEEAQYIVKAFASGSYYRPMNPWMDIDPYGRINISFCDNRLGRADTSHDYWSLNYTIQALIKPSTKPDLTPQSPPALVFYPSVQVSDQSWRFDSPRGNNMPPQEFNGIMADHRFVHCNWGDGRDNYRQGETYYSKAVIGGESPAGWIQTGYNLISFPAGPLFPDPFYMDGFPSIWDTLERLNPYTKEMETYPGDFKRVDSGRGYVLTASQPGVLTYPGFEPSVDTFEIALPVQGQTYIGCPFDAVIPFDDLSIRDENTGNVRSATEDLNSADPWLNWALQYYDTGAGAFKEAGPSELGLDDDAMRAWYGYIAYSNYDNLTLLVPRP
jgi:hypothetical protein